MEIIVNKERSIANENALSTKAEKKWEIHNINLVQGDPFYLVLDKCIKEKKTSETEINDAIHKAVPSYKGNVVVDERFKNMYFH